MIVLSLSNVACLVNLGWHQCSSCGKNANYMCYTCTFSLCKSCTKDSIIYCHKGKKGFCETCMRTIKLIEDNLKGNKNMVSSLFCLIHLLWCIVWDGICKILFICMFTLYAPSMISALWGVMCISISAVYCWSLSGKARLYMGIRQNFIYSIYTYLLACYARSK